MSYDTTASRQSMVSRLSNYWHPRERRDGSMASTSRRQASSRLSRRSEDGRHQGSIYEASEVADSAEDLRREMERQERDSDRLENVRACCDGKLFPPFFPSSLLPFFPFPGPFLAGIVEWHVPPFHDRRGRKMGCEKKRRIMLTRNR